MPALHADRGRETCEAEVHRHALHLDAPLLLLIGKALPDSVAGGISIVRQADLVVLVVGGAAPETNGVDEGKWRAPFALGQDLGLMCVDAGAVVLSVDARDVIERVVLDDRDAEKPVAENIRAADGKSVVVKRR